MKKTQQMEIHNMKKKKKTQLTSLPLNPQKNIDMFTYYVLAIMCQIWVSFCNLFHKKYLSQAFKSKR